MGHSFRKSAFRDYETGLYNEDYFREVFVREWYRLIREKDSLSLLTIYLRSDVMQLDNFRQLISGVIQENLLRQTDLASRLPNDEFIVGLFNQGESGAGVVATRLLKAFETYPCLSSKVSLGGVCVSPDNNFNIENIYQHSHELAMQAINNNPSKIQIEYLH